MEEKKEVVKNVTEMVAKIKEEKAENEDADISSPVVSLNPSHDHDCHCKTCKDSEKEIEQIRKKQFGIFKQNRHLKKAHYSEEMKKWDTAFVLKNRKTELIAEIRAASSYHACKMLGWKPQQAILLETINVKEREEKLKAEKVSESSTAVPTQPQPVEELKDESQAVVENNS